MVHHHRPSPDPPWLSPVGDEAMQAGGYRSEGAVALLLNEQGQFLLHLRDDNPAIPYPGTWGLLGGVVEPGETSEEALRRELLEEIEFVVGAVTAVGRRITPGPHLLTLYTGAIAKRIEDLPLREGAAIRYFRREALPDVRMAPQLKNVLLEYFRAERTPRQGHTSPCDP
jgi:8-oxo-dGTP pyrophosphatase MutT (NUDIX family)